MFQTRQKIGPYVLDRPLGEGSYGVVWLAEERTGLIERQVALKLPKDADPDIGAIRREAEVWLRAGKHPNVVQVLHADIYDGQVAIATEYIAGGSLHDRLRGEPGSTANLASAVEMTRGILAGLQHLHTLPPKPLVHRDLKPGNVLLRDDIPLLTDFGLSRAFSSTAFTQAGGTPGYMPPEAFDDRFSPQTDIWAAGVTLYRMLKGELPFPQRDLSALIGAILNKEPEPLPGFVPSPIAAVIFQSMMKDPTRRYASAEEMRVALEHAMRAGAHAVAAPTTRLAPIPPLPSDGPLAAFDITAPGTNVSPRQDVPGYATVGFPPLAARENAIEPIRGPLAPPMVIDGYRARLPQIPEEATAPITESQRVQEQRKPGYSELMTAVPERPELPAARQALSERIDGILCYLSRDTTRFCGALIASVPLWGALVGVGRIIERTRLIEAAPGVLLIAGLMSVLFARLAWHRYYWLPEATRRKTAIRYAILGLFSGTVVPVIAVTFYVAISGATSAPSEPPGLAPSTPKIEPPSR